MSGNIGKVNLEPTDRVTWPIASGYTNGINAKKDHPNPSDNIMNELGVHFYRLAQGNYTKPHHYWFDTDVVDRMAGFNVCVILDLLHVWILWRNRNGKADDYYVFNHLEDFEEAIEQSVSRIQPHITNQKKFWVNIWNEPDWWLDGGFWKGNYQDFQNTWRRAYNKLRSVLDSENKILGPGLSGFYSTHMHDILDWMNNNEYNENLLPDHISYHYPFSKLDNQLQDLQSWGYNQSVYIGEYLGPVEGEGYGRPGKFAYQIAAFTQGHITGAAIDPTGDWNIGGVKGLDGLIAELGTDKLTNLGYVCKLYTQATSVNNRPIASVLYVENAKYTKIFAARRYDKTHILMGTYRTKKENGKTIYLPPVMTDLELNNAEDYYHKVTLWIIPFSTKNDPCDESDLIKYNMGSSRPENGTINIDVTAWSQRDSAKVDACYIEVKKIIPPLSVYIDGPTEVPANEFSFWTADAYGGLPYYQYSWEIREHHEDTGWDDWNYHGTVPRQSYAPRSNVDMFEWNVTVADTDGNTAHYDLIVTVDH
jgi:hypothetical protein